MKKIFIFSLFLFLVVQVSFAQQEEQKPIFIKASYFDISPPLRDMVQKADAVTDNSWKEGYVKNKLNTYTNKDTDTDSPLVDAVHQSNFGDMVSSDTTLQNFDGIGSNGSVAPPDTDGDVGPNHFMQIVNSRFAVYSKTGTLLMGPSNNSTIFNGMPNNNNDGDGIILYDENADRWLFSQFSLPNYPNGPFFENVAISQTGDPTGTWYRYQFSFPDMPDYPKLAVWRDGYYMTIRRFASGSGNFLSCSAVAMDRAKMLAGDITAGMVMFNMPTSAEGTEAADCDSEFPPVGTPCPVAFLTSSTVKLYDFHVDWETPANSTFLQNYTVPIAMFGTLSGNVVPQKGTTQKLDAMSGRRIMFRMPYRKFSDHSSMLLSTTANVSGVAGIRWMELRNVDGAWTLFQEGTYAPGDGHWRWMGSIAMDSIGNIALGFSVSSSTLYPSIRYTGRMSCDPPGSMTIFEKGIMNGGGSQTPGFSDGRWGDYSAMVADPVTLGKFWYTQEYYSNNSVANWKTRIGSFGIFTSLIKATPALLCQNDSVQLSITASHGSGTYTYAWSSIPAGFTSTLRNPKAAVPDTTIFVCETSDGVAIRYDSIRLSPQPLPVVSAGADTTVCWYVTSINLNGSATNYTDFHWATMGTGTFSNATSFATTYFPTLAEKMLGHVDLNLIAGSNLPCTGEVSSTKRITFDVCAGMPGQTNNEPGLLIQPNPAHGTVAIGIRGIEAGSAMLSVTAMDGKMLFTENMVVSANSVIKTMDISGYARGIYFVQLNTGKKIITEKMIVK